MVIAHFKGLFCSQQQKQEHPLSISHALLKAFHTHSNSKMPKKMYFFKECIFITWIILGNMDLELPSVLLVISSVSTTALEVGECQLQCPGSKSQIGLLIRNITCPVQRSCTWRCKISHSKHPTGSQYNPLKMMKEKRTASLEHGANLVQVLCILLLN